MSFDTVAGSNRWVFGGVTLATILVITLIYWPVMHAEFVWDDILDFQRTAWLRHGGDWQQFLRHGFNDWVNYFRPLVIAMFTIEVRIFDVKPGPMHVVSLLIHLINTFLVGALAARISANKLPPERRIYAFALPMLFYGLHPLLVESVVWIGCQFDLMATLFMLLGWICNLHITRPLVRAISVATCFFLAACSKESAAAFPFILVLFDWFTLPIPRGTGKITQSRILLTRHGLTYVAVLAAGISYIALRHWSLGTFIPNSGGDTLPAWARLQEVSFLYARYWRMFFWPTIGMGPLHPVGTSEYLTLSAGSLLRDAIVISVVLVGAVLAFLRRYAGGLIIGVTLALLPVLHLVAANFDSSLYHERYAMTALAMLCVWFPPALAEISIPTHMQRILSFASLFIFAVWMTMAIMTVRVTVPLWSTQVKLWQWALQENPDFVGAKDELISAYIDQGSYVAAWKIIDELVKDHVACMNCMLNAASLSIKENDTNRAAFFLYRIKDSRELYASPSSFRFYLTTIGELKLMEGNPAAAEEVAQRAIAMDNLDTEPQLVLATSLALQGRIDEANRVEKTAVSLLPPDQRRRQIVRFESLLESLRAASAGNH